jgi:hypothetical protein
MHDYYKSTGNPPDTHRITMQNKVGGLWFSSNWIGPKTEEKNIAAGSLSVQ